MFLYLLLHLNTTIFKLCNKLPFITWQDQIPEPIVKKVEFRLLLYLACQEAPQNVIQVIDIQSSINIKYLLIFILWLMLDVWYKQKDIVLKSFSDASCMYLANLKVFQDLPKPIAINSFVTVATTELYYLHTWQLGCTCVA